MDYGGLGQTRLYNLGMHNCDETVKNFNESTTMKVSIAVIFWVGGDGDWLYVHGQAPWVGGTVLVLDRVVLSGVFDIINHFFLYFCICIILPYKVREKKGRGLNFK